MGDVLDRAHRQHFFWILSFDRRVRCRCAACRFAGSRDHLGTAFCREKGPPRSSSFTCVFRRFRNTNTGAGRSLLVCQQIPRATKRSPPTPPAPSPHLPVATFGQPGSSTRWHHPRFLACPSGGVCPACLPVWAFTREGRTGGCTPALGLAKPSLNASAHRPLPARSRPHSQTQVA
jgi:hypothetical protein